MVKENNRRVFQWKGRNFCENSDWALYAGTTFGAILCVLDILLKFNGCEVNMFYSDKKTRNGISIYGCQVWRRLFLIKESEAAQRVHILSYRPFDSRAYIWTWALSFSIKITPHQKHTPKLTMTNFWRETRERSIVTCGEAYKLQKTDIQRVKNID